MKTIALAALALGAGLALTPASAAPINSGLNVMPPDQLSDVIQIGERRKHRRRHRDHDFDFSFGFGVPFVGLGVAPYYDDYYYDRPDCIGWWHRHRSGRLHCHGELVYY